MLTSAASEKEEGTAPLRFRSVPFSNPLGFTWVETLERKG